MPKVAIWCAKLAKNFAELRAVNDCASLILKSNISHWTLAVPPHFSHDQNTFLWSLAGKYTKFKKSYSPMITIVMKYIEFQLLWKFGSMIFKQIFFSEIVITYESTYPSQDFLHPMRYVVRHF